YSALTVAAQTQNISGRVVDPANNPIVDVDVTVCRQCSGPMMNQLCYSGKTDANGRYDFLVPPPPIDSNNCSGSLSGPGYHKDGYSFRVFGQMGVTIGIKDPLRVVSSATLSGTFSSPESLSTVLGNDLASKTEVATTSPLPTILAGRTLWIRDSFG